MKLHFFGFFDEINAKTFWQTLPSNTKRRRGALWTTITMIRGSLQRKSAVEVVAKAFKRRKLDKNGTARAGIMGVTAMPGRRADGKRRAFISTRANSSSILAISNVFSTIRPEKGNSSIKRSEIRDLHIIET